MKRAIFILSFLIFYLLSFGQSRLFDRNVYQQNVAIINKVIPLPDGSWVSGGTLNDCFEIFVQRQSTYGDTIWTSPLMYGGIVTDIEQQVNTDIVVVGDYIGTDDVGGDEGAFIQIYDTSGMLKHYHIFFYNPLATSDSNHTAGCVWASMAHNQLVAVDTGNLLIASDSFIAKIRLTDWAVVWSKPVGTHINDMFIDAYQIYIATDSGLLKIDTAGNVLSRRSMASAVLKGYKSLNGNKYFIDTHGAYRIDTSLATINNYSSAQLIACSSIAGNQTGIYISGANGNGYLIGVFDSTLTYQRNIALNKQCAAPNDIAVYDTTIHVVTNYEDSFAYSNNFHLTQFDACNRTISISGNSNLSVSAIQIISADSVAITRVQSAGMPGWYSIDMVSKITLKNTGLDTIHELNLRSEIIAAMNCSKYFSFNGIKNLAVAPQAVFEVFDTSHYIFASATTIINRSFYITGINKARPNDNCTLLTINLAPFIYIGINELTPPSFHIYPNPTTNILNIQTEQTTTNTTFTLHELTGKTLLQKTLTDNNTAIDISAFAMGLYIYTIKDGVHNPVTGKVEKL